MKSSNSHHAVWLSALLSVLSVDGCTTSNSASVQNKAKSAIQSTDVNLAITAPRCAVALASMPTTFTVTSDPPANVVAELIRPDGSVTVVARVDVDATPRTITIVAESPGKNRVVVWPGGMAKTATQSFTLDVVEAIAGASLDDLDNDCYSPAAGDCDDNDARINPGAAELCDDVDNNCDGKYDEAFDLDHDGFAACTSGLALAHQVDGSSCPNGYASCEDCNDGDAGAHPGAQDGFCQNAGKSCRVFLATNVDSSNIYVDVANIASGDGSPACPVRNIGEAITKVTPGGTIHVAAGTYKALTGEVFPLRFDQGVTVVGAGRGKTILEGADAVDLNEHSGFFTDYPTNFTSVTTQATIWAHNKNGQLLVRDLSLRGKSFTGSAFLCDRGNASNAFRPDETPAGMPTANFVLDNVDVGPGYGYLGYVVHGGPADSSDPQGCNAEITRSYFQDSDCGIWAAGTGAGPHNSHVVHLTLGTDATSGNQFSNIGMRAGGPSCSGDVIAWYGTSPLFLRGNTFADSRAGVYAIHTPAANTQGISRAEFTDNKFLRLFDFGLLLDYAFVLEKLVGNDFENITNPGGQAAAVWLSGSGSSDRAFVLAARANKFLSSDNGIWIGNPSTTNPLYSNLKNNFSKTALSPDPGPNVFACNSTPAGAAASGVFGGDFVLVGGSGDTNASLRLSDNNWDHVFGSSPYAPTVELGPISANGRDIALEGTSSTTLDSLYNPASGAGLANVTCPSGVIKGP